MSTTMVNIMVDSRHREVQPMASRAGAEGQRHLLIATMLARVWFQLPVPCAAAADNFVSPSIRRRLPYATAHCPTFSQLVILCIKFKIGELVLVSYHVSKCGVLGINIIK